MAKTISRDVPLSELTLRRYEKPGQLEKRELVRKLCLSLGMLQPGDSRDVVVDIFRVLLDASREKKLISEEQIEALVKEKRKNTLGTAPSNIRRQLRRLREIGMVEKVKNMYRITEFFSLRELVEEKIAKIHLPSILERIKEYCDALEKHQN